MEYDTPFSLVFVHFWHMVISCSNKFSLSSIHTNLSQNMSLMQIYCQKNERWLLLRKRDGLLDNIKPNLGVYF